MVLFLSSERLKSDLLNENVDDNYVRSATIIAQHDLRELVGDCLYERLEDLVENETIEGTPYKNLLDSFIVPYLEFKAMAELCINTTYKIGNIGLFQNFDTNANSNELSTVKYISTHYEQKAEFYRNRLVKFLEKERETYPEYSDCGCDSITPPSGNRVVRSGLWLGGR